VSLLPAHLNSWERFGVEFCLTFIVVLTYFVSMDTYRKWLGSSPLVIGAAYLACTLVSVSNTPKYQSSDGKGGGKYIMISCMICTLYKRLAVFLEVTCH
jgi:glycerol uptake facilitator-like aquaporin